MARGAAGSPPGSERDQGFGPSSGSGKWFDSIVSTCTSFRGPASGGRLWALVHVLQSLPVHKIAARHAGDGNGMADHVWDVAELLA